MKSTAAAGNFASELLGCSTHSFALLVFVVDELFDVDGDADDVDSFLN